MRAYPCEELSGAITMFPVGHLEGGQMGERNNQPENSDCHEKGTSAGEKSNLCLLDIVNGGKAGASKNDEIVGVAKSSLGDELWRKTEGVTGSMGAAAAVSEVLLKAGLMDHSVGTVKDVAKILKEKHWEPRKMDERQPGDVMLRTNDGFSNIGIVGPDNTVFVNRRNGVFSQMSIGNSSLRENALVFHPPEKK